MANGDSSPCDRTGSDTHLKRVCDVAYPRDEGRTTVMDRCTLNYFHPIRNTYGPHRWWWYQFFDSYWHVVLVPNAASGELAVSC